MDATATAGADFRFAVIGELGEKAKAALKRLNPIVSVILVSVAIYQIITDKPGGYALLLISVGNYLALGIWGRKGLGLPLMPMIAIQHLIVYGLPLLTLDTISYYSQDCLTNGGIEVFVFLLVLALAWRGGLAIFTRSPAVCYGLKNLTAKGQQKLAKVGFLLILLMFAYQMALRTTILDLFLGMLPSGIYSIVWALVSAAGTCGFFIISLLIGSGSVTTTQRLMFWVFLAFNCAICASSFLLSSAIVIVITVMIGLFWSTGKVPWIYLTVVLSIFGYLNIGKIVMRERYWGDVGADAIPVFTLNEIPDHYMEWCEASYDCLAGNVTEQKEGQRAVVSADSKQSLLERINNMQNLLYVIDAMQVHHIEPLYGETYTIIPKLLIPRFLWPDKPGTHEGQVILNVHFGRQDLESTTKTYIAWGLLPEAYGNFGPIGGATFLGVVLGLLFAWLERETANKLVISIEGFAAFTVFVGMVNSFELVASVLVTSIEQSIIPIVVATAPFARQIVVVRRHKDKA